MCTRGRQTHSVDAAKAAIALISLSKTNNRRLLGFTLTKTMLNRAASQSFWRILSTPRLAFTNSGSHGRILGANVHSHFPQFSPPSGAAQFSSKSGEEKKEASDTALGKIMSPENQGYAVIAGGTVGILVFAKG